MGFRRGSRSSRAKKQDTTAQQVQDAAELIQQMQASQSDRDRLADDQYQRDKELENYGRQCKAREEQQRKAREENEQRKEALRRARRTQRREQSNSLSREKFRRRHPVKPASDPRLLLATRLLDNPALPEGCTPTRIVARDMTHSEAIAHFAAISLHRGFNKTKNLSVTEQ